MPVDVSPLPLPPEPRTPVYVPSVPTLIQPGAVFRNKRGQLCVSISIGDSSELFEAVVRDESVAHAAVPLLDQPCLGSLQAQPGCVAVLHRIWSSRS